jgi:hypothetical protein
MTLTAARLREVLHYDPVTGVFTWLPRPFRLGKLVRAEKTWNTRYAGCAAGCNNGEGYFVIGIDGDLHLAHRLAFLYQTGVWPTDQIDHNNMDRADNRWCNLREATDIQNKANRCVLSTNKSGFAGVCWNKSNRKWHARIRVDDDKQRHLGYFDRLEHAAYIYHAASLWRHGPFARVDDSYRSALDPGKLVILDAIREKFADLHDQVASVYDQRERLGRAVAPYTYAVFEKRVLTNLADLSAHAA